VALQLRITMEIIEYTRLMNFKKIWLTVSKQFSLAELEPIIRMELRNE
jgi:hypothetical protein